MAIGGICSISVVSPDNIEAYNDYVTCLMMKGDDALLEDILRRWYASGTYSASMLNYSYNALCGMDSNSIYFVQGDSPTYSALMVQYGKGLFKSIKTISTGLLIRQQTQIYRLFSLTIYAETKTIPIFAIHIE